jgi:hypothetical protein
MAITITPALAGSVGNRIAYLVTVEVSAGTTGAQTATIANATLQTDAINDSPVEDFFQGSYGSTAAAQTAVFATHTWNVSAISGAALSGQFAFTAAPDAAATLLTVTLDFRLAAAADGTYLFLLEFIFNEVGYSYPHGGPG